jgi:hypothetical protein
MIFRSKERLSHDSDNSEISYLSHDPTSASRIGDIGYVDRCGHWRQILNVFDRESCRRLGINSIRLSSRVLEYTTRTKYEPFDKPIVRLYDGGHWRYLETNELSRYQFPRGG